MLKFILVYFQQGLLCSMRGHFIQFRSTCHVIASPPLFTNYGYIYYVSVKKQQIEAAQRQVQSVEEENTKLLQKILEFETQMKKSVFKVTEKDKAEMEKMKESNEKIVAMRIKETTRLNQENQKIEAENTEKTIEEMKQ